MGLLGGDLTEKQIEVAARKYCELAGLDPDKLVQAPSPIDAGCWTYAVLIQHKQWHSVAARLRDQSFMDEAIRHALST